MQANTSTCLICSPDSLFSTNSFTFLLVRGSTVTQMLCFFTLFWFAAEQRLAESRHTAASALNKALQMAAAARPAVQQLAPFQTPGWIATFPFQQIRQHVDITSVE